MSKKPELEALTLRVTITYGMSYDISKCKEVTD
jgi:hypothetical protein